MMTWLLYSLPLYPYGLIKSSLALWKDRIKANTACV